MASKEARSYIAKEIEQYHATKHEIDNILIDIELESYAGGKDPTYRAASVLVDHRALKRMMLFVKTFDEVFHRLTKEKQKVIELLYWSSRDFNCNGVGMAIGVDGSTVGRWRITILNEIAERMGMK